MNCVVFFSLKFFFWWGSFESLYLICCAVTSVVYVLVFWPQDMCNLSSPIWNQTWTPSSGRWSLNQWTAREIPSWTTLDDSSTFVCLRSASPSNSWDICIVLFFFFHHPQMFSSIKKNSKKHQSRPCFVNSFLRIEKQKPKRRAPGRSSYSNVKPWQRCRKLHCFHLEGQEIDLEKREFEGFPNSGSMK